MITTVKLHLRAARQYVEHPEQPSLSVLLCLDDCGDVCWVGVRWGGTTWCTSLPKLQMQSNVAAAIEWLLTALGPLSTCYYSFKQEV